MKKIYLFFLVLVSISSLATPPSDAILGTFSISENKKVYFSKGNLNYSPSTKKWKFASYQYDFVGKNNLDTSASTNTGWIDNFCWSTANNNYGTNVRNRAQSAEDFVDWGNTIGAGWRTLSKNEWNYLLNRNGIISYVLATITIRENDSINGLLLLPDNWYNSENKIIAGQRFKCEISEWFELEKTNVVFLPMAGTTDACSYYTPNTGAYWTTTNDSENKTIVSVNWSIEDGISYYNDNPSARLSVRLVYDVPSEDTPTALQDVENVDIYTENGRIVCNSEFQIFDLLGRDVTRMNGQLNGIYVVKVGDKAQKVIVR
jgi:hypothetical protein